MTNNSFNDSPKNPEPILSKFESARQISEMDQVRFDIERLRSPTTRAAKEQALQSHIDLGKTLDAQFDAAQNAYVDKHLQPDPTLEPGLGGHNEDRYAKQVEKLQIAFKQTPEAGQMRENHNERKERGWSTLRHSVSAELRRQERSHER